VAQVVKQGPEFKSHSTREREKEEREKGESGGVWGRGGREVLSIRFLGAIPSDLLHLNITKSLQGHG
jgi:hypothetical protein